MTSHHRVLMVGEEGVMLYAPVKNGIGCDASISWEAPDFEQRVVQALGENRVDPAVVVLFNDADHYYIKRENLPVDEHLTKLESDFGKFPARAALEIKPSEKDETGKLVGNYIFVGLPNSAHHDLLGRALKGAGIPLAGCGVLPVESTGLVAALAERVFARESKKSHWSVLVSQHETGGMRHVCIKDGVLALTRLFPQPDIDKIGANGWVEGTTAELQATMHYLRRFGFTDDQGMNIMIISNEAEKSLFNPDAILGANIHCFTLTEALRHLDTQVSGQADEHFGDALYAAWSERAEALQLHLPVYSG